MVRKITKTAQFCFNKVNFPKGKEHKWSLTHYSIKIQTGDNISQHVSIECTEIVKLTKVHAFRYISLVNIHVVPKLSSGHPIEVIGCHHTQSLWR